jgi:hypothetical protein
MSSTANCEQVWINQDTKPIGHHGDALSSASYFRTMHDLHAGSGH